VTPHQELGGGLDTWAVQGTQRCDTLPAWLPNTCCLTVTQASFVSLRQIQLSQEQWMKLLSCQTMVADIIEVGVLGDCRAATNHSAGPKPVCVHVTAVTRVKLR